jgi:hypothetical protein
MEPESSSPRVQEPATYMPLFLLSQRHKSNRKHFCATHSNCIPLTVTCSSEIHTERIAAFALQQWLHERANMLRHTYIV